MAATAALAADLRRAFSGIVAGNVKEDGMRRIEERGPFEIHGDADMMQALDALLGLEPDVRFAIAPPRLALTPSLRPLIARLPQARPDLVALQLGYRSTEATVRAAILGLSTSNGASNAPGAAATRVTKDENGAPATTTTADSSAASSTESAAADDGTAKPQGVSETAPKVAAPAAVAQAAPPVSALPSPAPKPEMIARETRHTPGETAPPKVTAPAAKTAPKIAQVQSVIPIVTAPPAQRPQASATAGRALTPDTIAETAPTKLAPTEAADEVTAAVGQPTPLLRAPAPPAPARTFAETATSEPAGPEPAPSGTAQAQTVIPIVTALAEPPANAFPAPSAPAEPAAPVRHASSKPASSKPASSKPAPSQTAQVQTVIPIVTALAEPPVDVPSIPAPPAMLDEPADHPAAEHARSKIALAEGLVPPAGALAESPAELPPIPAPPAESEPTAERAAVAPLPPKTPAAPETPHVQTVIPVVTAPAEPAVELPSFPVPAESKPAVRHAAVAPLPAKTPANSSTPPSKGRKANREARKPRQGPRAGSVGRQGGGRGLALEPAQVGYHAAQ